MSSIATSLGAKVVRTERLSDARSSCEAKVLGKRDSVNEKARRFAILLLKDLVRD